jgi:hypothetical protein
MAAEMSREGMPVFGEWFRGIWAGENNPLRDGRYVRTIRRTGRCNPGTFYELTDGKGRFWQFEAKETLRHSDFTDEAALTRAADALMRERHARKFPSPVAAAIAEGRDG